MAASCKDDFKVAAPYKTITVVYGMINRDDTAHYFRIQKAFLDDNKSAIELAGISDSSNYTNLVVTMKEYFDNGTYIRTLPPLTKVDMAKEGYPKDAAGYQGFFTSPSYGYKLKMASATDTLDPFKNYRLIIFNPNTQETDSTDYLKFVNTRRSQKNPSDFYVGSFVNGNFSLSFAKTDFKATYSLIGNTPANAKIIEGVIRFNMVETNAATGTKTRKSADYHFASATPAGVGVDFELNVQNSGFYGFLRDEFGAPGPNITRQLDSCDVFVYAGSYELYNYQVIAGVQNSSLLGDQIKPIYTNLRGANVQGLVASRAIRFARNVPVDNVTLDSIKLNPLTKDLVITGRSAD